MEDYIKLPRSMLTDKLTHDPNLSRLLLYLLKRVDETGKVSIGTNELNREYGWSRQQSRTLVSKLKDVTRATATSTARATTLIFDIQPKKTKHQPREQPRHQPRDEAIRPIAQDGYERFREYFNSAVSGTLIPQIIKLTDRRKTALLAIFKEYGKETVESVMQKVLDSDFLTRKWGKASFDWIFKKANFIKILEGNYDNKPTVKETYAVRKQDDRYSALEAAAEAVVQRSAAYDNSADVTGR